MKRKIYSQHRKPSSPQAFVLSKHAAVFHIRRDHHRYRSFGGVQTPDNTTKTRSFLPLANLFRNSSIAPVPSGAFPTLPNKLAPFWNTWPRSDPGFLRLIGFQSSARSAARFFPHASIQLLQLDPEVHGPQIALLAFRYSYGILLAQHLTNSTCLIFIQSTIVRSFLFGESTALWLRDLPGILGVLEQNLFRALVSWLRVCYYAYDES